MATLPESPEAQAGRRLDAHHDADATVLSACVVCGFTVTDSFGLGLRHLPLPYEVRHVDAWLVRNDPSPAA